MDSMDDDWEESFAPRKNRRMTKEKAMLGDWADEDSEDEDFGHFAGLGTHKTKSKRGKQGIGSAIGSLMFVSSGVHDLASLNKKESESAMEVDATPEAPPKPEPKAPKKSDATKLGAWERHTKGLGSRMLKKMGWTGKGLGANESGMVEPIQVVARAAGAGLDESDYMGVQKSTYRQNEPATESVVESKPEVRKDQWKKDAPKVAPKPNVPKVVYKSRQELEQQYGRESKQVIIDMRPPSERLPDTSQMEVDALHTRFMPELRHNLTHLVDLKVNAIHTLESKRHYSEAQLKTLSSEESSLNYMLEGQKTDITYLTSLKNQLAHLQQNSSDISAVDYLQFFQRLKDLYPAEWKKYQLESLIFHYVFPRLNYDLLSWRPLYQPTQGLETMLQWRSLLVEKEEPDVFMDTYDDGFGISSRIRLEQEKSTRKSLETYQRMAYEIILPKLRAALLEWDVTNPDLAIDLLTTWKSALPAIAYNFLLYHTVENKLRDAISKFELGGLPLDTWVTPWIPIMGTQNVPTLLEDIRRKLQRCISKVENATQGVEMLKPFQGVLDSQNWSQLMARGVLSRIELLLRSIEIDPSQQDMSAWREARVWAQLVSTEAFAMALAESGFWKKWFRILGEWVHQPDVELDQVQQWYGSWKKQMPAELVANRLVQPQFRTALQLMITATTDEIAPLSQFVPAKVEQAPETLPSSTNKASITSVARPPWQEQSLKELLEEAAEEHGTLFMGTGRKFEGNPVYTFGNTSIYLDRDVIYALDGPSWRPVSISELITL